MRSTQNPPTPTTNFLDSSRPDTECKTCWDTGYHGWKTPHSYPLAQVRFCDCHKGESTRAYWERRSAALRVNTIERLFKSASIPTRFADLTVGTLARLDDPAKAQAIEACKELIQHGSITQRGSPRDSLLLSGPFGVGKTGLLTAVLAHFLEHGHAGLWIEYYDLVLEIQQGYSDNTSHSRLDAARNADWLLLDDVGDLERRDGNSIRLETDDRRKILYTILNHRHNNRLPTLITTNLNPGQLSQQFGERVTQRIMESFCVIGIAGKNLRLALIDTNLET